MPLAFANTALLVFSRSAAEEAIIKPLVVNGLKRQCTAITAKLIRHTQAIARTSGLPVFFFSARQQRGNSFGERFAHAFETLFARGFSQVIAIGNDCPTLTAQDIRAAAQQLTTQDFVLGPARDGGAWLIGMHSAAYRRAEFKAIDWQTERVFAQLSALAAGSVYCLALKDDIDAAADLQRQLQGGNMPFLLKACIVQLLLIAHARPGQILKIFRPTFFITQTLLRGPPLVA